MMLFKSHLACRGFWFSNILWPEKDLSIQVGEIDDIFIKQDYFLDSKTTASHCDSTA
jgi:hypothetical protein